MCVLRRFWFCVGVLLIADLSPAQVVRKEICLSCHGVQGLERTEKGKSVSLYVNKEVLSGSAHGGLECTACHSDISTIPHPSQLQPVQCSVCHTDAAKVYGGSVHGKAYTKGDREAATCSKCHGSHNILPAKNPDSRVYPLNLPRTCGVCHGDPELAKRHRIPVANAYQLYMDSIHGRALTKSGLLVAANCSSCHGSHLILPASDPNSAVHKTKVPETCGQCHAGILRLYEMSIHGQLTKAGSPAAPVCNDCHTSHEIRRVELEPWKLQIIRECGTCHVESLRTYRDTFHGQVTALGFTRVARCSDCHGAHDILPKSDPRSSVSPARVVSTCQKCHAGANSNFAQYDPHADPGNRARNPVLYYTARFMDWLIVGVFVFFGFHTALWAGRFLRLRGRRGPEQKERIETGGES